MNHSSRRRAIRGGWLLMILIGWIGCSPVCAQKEVSRQSLYWLRYYNILNFSEKWSWHNELDTRHYFLNSRQNNYIIHSRISYKPSTLYTIAGAVTYSLQRPADPYLQPRPGIPEYRLWQEFSLNQSLPKNLSLSYRLRTEERFISNHVGSFDKDYAFAFRHRYRLQLTYPIVQWSMTLRASEELFYYMQNGHLFERWDQNRFYVSIDKKLSPALTLELGYMNIHQGTPKANYYNNRNIARLTLYHTLNLY